MDHLDTEHPSPRPTTTDDLADDESVAMQQCDFCGTPVRRETAVARPSGDGGKVVLCTKCEFGVD